jgi:hypothetical protein
MAACEIPTETRTNKHADNGPEKGQSSGGEPTVVVTDAGAGQGLPDHRLPALVDHIGVELVWFQQERSTAYLLGGNQ